MKDENVAIKAKLNGKYTIRRMEISGSPYQVIYTINVIPSIPYDDVDEVLSIEIEGGATVSKLYLVEYSGGSADTAIVASPIKRNIMMDYEPAEMKVSEWIDLLNVEIEKPPKKRGDTIVRKPRGISHARFISQILLSLERRKIPLWLPTGTITFQQALADRKPSSSERTAERNVNVIASMDKFDEEKDTLSDVLLYNKNIIEFASASSEHSPTSPQLNILEAVSKDVFLLEYNIQMTSFGGVTTYKFIAPKGVL